jgi:hypothetical protein
MKTFIERCFMCGKKVTLPKKPKMMELVFCSKACRGRHLFNEVCKFRIRTGYGEGLENAKE